MKKIVMLFIIGSMMCSLCGCGRFTSQIEGENAELEELEQKIEDLDVVIETLENFDTNPLDDFDYLIAQGPKENYQLVFDLPEDFVYAGEFPASEGMVINSSELYVPSDYPNTMAEVSWVVTNDDGSFSMMNAETLATIAEAQLKTNYGETVELTILDERAYTIDSIYAFTWSYEYEICDISVKARQVSADVGDEVCCITYIDYGAGLFETFEESANNIRYEEIVELTYDLPEGFYESIVEEGLYISPNYPEEESTIDYTEFNYRATLIEDALTEGVQNGEAQLETELGIDVTMEMSEFTHFDVDGYPAIKYTLDYDVMGTVTKQIVVLVEGPKKTYMLNCTERNNEGYYDAFEALIENLRFEVQ